MVLDVEGSNPFSHPSCNLIPGNDLLYADIRQCGPSFLKPKRYRYRFARQAAIYRTLPRVPFFGVGLLRCRVEVLDSISTSARRIVSLLFPQDGGACVICPSAHDQGEGRIGYG